MTATSRRRLGTASVFLGLALFLLPGTYRVTAELSGFQTKDHPSVQVRVGERLQLDMTLQPAGVTEQVPTTRSSASATWCSRRTTRRS